MAATISRQDIETKRKQVRRLCAEFGDQSPEYNETFDELRALTNQFMVESYRRERGLPPNAKTPYC